MKRACPRLHFKRIDLRDPAGRILATRIEARTKAKGPLVGAITLRNGIRVSHIAVEPAMQRCGVATRLYERAAKIACVEHNTPLKSDIERSKAAQGFWEKQVDKGRARCVEPEQRTEAFVDDAPTTGRGGCSDYELTCPAPTSLARPPRR